MSTLPGYYSRVKTKNNSERMEKTFQFMGDPGTVTPGEAVILGLAVIALYVRNTYEIISEVARTKLRRIGGVRVERSSARNDDT